METIDGNPIATETLTGVLSSFHPPPDEQPHKILKPTSDEEEGGGAVDLPPENEVLAAAAGEASPPENEALGGGGGGDGGGGTVVVTTTTTTVIERTKISIVEKIQEENKEDEKEGHFGNLVGDFDEDAVFVDAEGSFSVENGSEENAGGDLFGVEKHDTEAVESAVDTTVENNDEKPKNVAKSETESGFQQNGQEGEKTLEKPENVDDSDPKPEDQENDQDCVGNVPENEGYNNPMETVESGKQDAAEKKVEKLDVDNADPKSEFQENGQPENEGDNDGDGEETEVHDFVVGDFVWGKIKSHPWWPGQIYEPSDASDYAVTLRRKNHLLVAYFGDGSFSWCSPSQLKPFIDPFDEMSTQSDSKKFVNAVQNALEAVGKLVEAEMTCKCRAVGPDGGGGGDAAVNSGIKAGVGMPKGNTVKVLIERMDPVELLETVKVSATMDPALKTAGLELAVLKGCLSSFYRQKGGGQSLPEYHDPEYIEGLEDGSRSGFVSDCDKNGPSESGDGKSSQKRKQKSVAELLGEEEPKVKKAKTGSGSGSGLLKKERKRKTLVVSVTPESDHDSGGGGIEEETMSPRQRKKSKYLSPPYLSPIWTGKLSGSFKEVKTESEKVPEMAAKHLEGSVKKRRKSRSQEDDEKTAIIGAAVNVSKVLKGLLRAALDPPSFVEKKRKKVPEVSEFISAYRSSVFEEGSSMEKKGAAEESGLEVIERKLVAIREMVKGCEEGEMSEEMKGSLEEGLKEVIERVGEMK